MQLYIYQFFIKLLMVIFVTLFFVRCGGDDPAREAATEAARKAADEKKNLSSVFDPNEATPTRPKEVGQLPLRISSAKVAKGERACLSVTATQFNEIVSMQYTMKWDPSVLTFREVKNFGLPGMAASNFGERAQDKGILAYSWFDANVAGITKPDGTVLYDACFEATGEKGSSTTFEFADAPVVIEISNSASQFLGIDAVNGKVVVE